MMNIANKEKRMDLRVSLETDVFPLWSEYPQLQMVREEVQKSNNLTLTPVIQMAAGTGFGTGTATTMTTASAAKSKPVETQKANQVSHETEAAPTAPPAVGDVAGEATLR
jgi:pantoate kinase